MYSTKLTLINCPLPPGHVIVPEALNMPSSLVMEHSLGLPNCMMLHKNLMVAWESFPPQLTSGDVAVTYMDEYLGHVEDYQLTIRCICPRHYPNKTTCKSFQVCVSTLCWDRWAGGL